MATITLKTLFDVSILVRDRAIYQLWCDKAVDNMVKWIFEDNDPAISDGRCYFLLEKFAFHFGTELEKDFLEGGKYVH
jgi:hypothetical protein